MLFKFCPECGHATRPGDGFCAKCGQALAGPAMRPVLRPAGLVVFVLVALLGAGWWLHFLYGEQTPQPPKPGEGAPMAAAPASGAAAPSGMASAPPAVELPQEVRTLLADARKKAEAAPGDLALWSQLARMLYRASQIDRAYASQAQDAFNHVLEIDPKNSEALRGLGNLAYDKRDTKTAIGWYEKLLVLTPDDPEVRTDLGTMRFESGDAVGAQREFAAVIASKPDFYKAHFNLGIVLDAQGKRDEARAAVERAREAATDPDVRRRLQTLLDAATETGGDLTQAARLAAERLAPPAGPAGGGAPAAVVPPAPPPIAAGTAGFPARVERVFRAHPVAGPKIVRLEWPEPRHGRVLMAGFPMDQMPPVMRESWLGKMRTAVRAEAAAAGVDEVVEIEIVDLESGKVMAQLEP